MRDRVENLINDPQHSIENGAGDSITAKIWWLEHAASRFRIKENEMKRFVYNLEFVVAIIGCVCSTTAQPATVFVTTAYDGKYNIVTNSKIAPSRNVQLILTAQVAEGTSMVADIRGDGSGNKSVIGNLQTGANSSDQSAPSSAGHTDWKDATNSCASYRGRIDILDCGADNTGRSDSAGALNRALSNARAQDEIYFPAGNYLIASDITLPEQNIVVNLVGESRGAADSVTTQTGTNLIYSGSGTMFMSSDPTNGSHNKETNLYQLQLDMRDITLQSQNASTTNIAMNLDGMNHVNLTRVRIKGFWKGVVGVTKPGRASYNWDFDDVEIKSYGNQNHPDAEWGYSKLTDTAIEIGTAGDIPLYAGHMNFKGLRTENVRAAMVLTGVSNITSTNLTVDTSCVGIQGYRVESSTFTNSYIDSNPTVSRSRFGNCGTHPSGVRVILVGGRGNVVSPTDCDGCAANKTLSDIIDPKEAIVLSPEGENSRPSTVNHFSGTALDLAEDMYFDFPPNRGVYSHIRDFINLSAARFTSVEGESTTITAPNTLTAGTWISFMSLDAPKFLRIATWYFVVAADASSFTLYTPVVANGSSGTSTGVAQYDGARVRVIGFTSTPSSSSFSIGDYDSRFPINLYSTTINLYGAVKVSGELSTETVSAKSYNNSNGATVIPSTATGYTGSGTTLAFGQSGTTGSIGGSALKAGTCAIGTAALAVSATGHPGIAAASDGSVQGNYMLNVSVRDTIATVSVCALTAGTPEVKTYNVMVF